jgi:hypothetical protein
MRRAKRLLYSFVVQALLLAGSAQAQDLMGDSFVQRKVGIAGLSLAANYFSITARFPSAIYQEQPFQFPFLSQVGERIPARNISLSVERRGMEEQQAQRYDLNSEALLLSGQHKIDFSLNMQFTGEYEPYQMQLQVLSLGARCKPLYEQITQAIGQPDSASDSQVEWSYIGIDQEELVTARCVDFSGYVVTVTDPQVVPRFEKSIAERVEYLLQRYR